jgi:hypothetical protein
MGNTSEVLHHVHGLNVFIKRTFVEIDVDEETKNGWESERSTDAGRSSDSDDMLCTADELGSSLSKAYGDADGSTIASTDDESQSGSVPLPGPPGTFLVCPEAVATPAKPAARKAWGREKSQAERNYTTVVVKGLSTTCTNIDFKQLLDACQLKGQYNFLYVPVDFSTRISFGYGFVNFVTHNAALQALSALDGRRSSSGPLQAHWSLPHQGYTVHVRRYQNSPVMHASVPEHFRPMIFRKGVQQVFPAPTKKIREPRARRGPQAESFQTSI